VTDAERRPGLNVLLCGDRLFQQYVVDSCAKNGAAAAELFAVHQNSLRML